MNRWIPAERFFTAQLSAKKSHSAAHYFIRLPNCMSGLVPKKAFFTHERRVPAQKALKRAFCTDRVPLGDLYQKLKKLHF